MKLIPLSGKNGQGKFAIVDDEDYEYLARYKWYLITDGYAARYAGCVEGRSLITRMHREILQAPNEMQVDHINHDGLDNRRGNIRVCSRSQNYANKGKMPGKTGYKGVYRVGNKWRAVIAANRKQYYIGRFSSELDAAKAYDEAAKKYHGEFAKLNLE